MSILVDNRNRNTPNRNLDQCPHTTPAKGVNVNNTTWRLSDVSYSV